MKSWQDTFIISGHRRRSNSFLKCFHSLFYLHNEFVNTHSVRPLSCLTASALLHVF